MTQQTTSHKKTKLAAWDPEHHSFWSEIGKPIALRNLFISTFSLFLSFAVWVMWSVMVIHLHAVGFQFDPIQLFTLTAIPGLVGAGLRVIYSFVVPLFGGRNWTVISTASLLLPTIWLGHAIQDPTTSYQTMLIIAVLCGLGGGNFSSSMANISFFFPKRRKGIALGINAGIGNLGVSALQFTAPYVICIPLFGTLGGEPQMVTGTATYQFMWLQNIAFIWVIPIIIFTLAALLWMNNLPTAKTSLTQQLVIFKRKHMYITTALYTMSFGSFIGFSFALPLLIKTVYPEINPLTYAFIGPMLGALLRPVGGWLADKSSGSKITCMCIVVMIIALGFIIHFIQPASRDFWGFLTAFLVVFITTGLANGSVFRMIGVIFPPKEAAPVLGMSAAIAALGAFFIPKMFALSLHITGYVYSAFYIFIIYDAICLIALWYWYMRRSATIRA